MSDNGADDTVTLTIDGKEVTVPKGTLIIRAAEQIGTIIPRFCDHPLLDPVGACRQCIVEVEGQRKPMMACTTPVGDGMEVRTHLTSEVARKGQAGTLEFLLINHPLDCPMCDKGGECPLQDQALAHGQNFSRFVDEKRRYNKPVAVSPLVLLDRERCVLCARCTRFSEQISGHPFIELFERGALEQVAIYEDEPYESYFSGNVIQICPVGALTSVDYRFKARPFDVRSAPSVCDHCASGCALTVQSRKGEIQRQLARVNMSVNEAWNCDKGRFGYGLLTSDRRVDAPHARRDGELAPTSWAEALMTTVRAVRDAEERGPGRVAVLTGARLADEDAYAVSKYARAVLRTDHVDFRTDFSGDDRTDELLASLGRRTATYADVEQAPTIVVVGLDPEEELPILFLRIRKAWRRHKAKIVVVGPRLGTLRDYTWRWLPTRPGEETRALEELADAVAGSDASGAVADVAGSLGEGGAVVLVGERAPRGALRVAARLAGAVDGLVAATPRRAGARGALDAGLVAGALPGGRRLDDPDDRAAVEAVWGDLPAERGASLRGVLEACAAGDVDVLHLIGVDLLRDADDPELARRAVAKVGTVVAQDLAWTDTTEAADVVLPVAATQERTGSLTNWEGRTQTFRPAVPQPAAVQEDWEIVQQLAALLGHDLGFNDLDGLRAERERLGVRAAPHDWPATSTAGDDAASDDPGDAAASDDPGGGSGADGLDLVSYPLLLDRGVMLHDAEHVTSTARDAHVALSPPDADRLGLRDGDLASVRGEGGEVDLPVRVDDGMYEGVAFVPSNSTDRPLRALGGADRRVSVTARQEVQA